MPRTRRAAGAALLLAIVLLAGFGAGPVLAQDPGRTATIFVPGYEQEGADQHGIFGYDRTIPQLDSIAAMAGLPTADSGAVVLPRNVVTATSYYGDVAPPWATAADLAELAAIDTQWGGGVPRYAAIVAGYARDVLARSGADRVSFVTASFGSEIVRWLIEKDLRGLASQGKIARWLTIEGVLSGNWAASRSDLRHYLDQFQPQPIDVDHMTYDWVSTNLHSPRTEADDADYAKILIGQFASTDDDYNDAALSNLMRTYDAFQPNDGVQAVADAIFQTVTARSRFMGLPPMTSYFASTHLAMKNDRGAWAAAAIFATQKRRVTVTLTTARVDDLHEPQQPWWDWRPAEVVLQWRVYSPRVQSRWAVTGPLSARERAGAAAPLLRFDQNGETRTVNLPVYDGLVLDDETKLRIELHGEEVDYDWRYGVYETAQQPWYDELGTATVEVSTLAAGTYAFSAGAWSGQLQVTVTDYPFTTTTAVIPAGPPAAARLEIAPNPHRGAAMVRLAGAPALAAGSTLEIFDTSGRRVRRLSGDAARGIVWDGRDERGGATPAGLYLFRLSTAGGVWQGRSLRMN